jgi:N-acetylmuramoyl-L-alanine amidase
MNVAFVVGHHQKAKGKFSNYFGLTEWDFYNKVLKHFKNPTIFYHNPSTRSYVNRQIETGEKINSFPFDLVIELHFNSFNTKASGVETFYHHKSIKGRKYAEKFNEVCVRWTGLTLRGAKPLSSSSQNGYGFLNSNKYPSILIEPFFGDNENDCKAIKSPKQMACIIEDFIRQIS